jgi:hypothetical protein
LTIRKRPLVAAVGTLLGCLAFGAGPAHAGSGEVYSYKKHETPIPDGHGKATMKLPVELPNDVDPTVGYVSISVRIDHSQTHDLVLRLKRPDFHYMGSPQSGIPRVLTVDDRETHGKNLGKGKCPADPSSVPGGFMTLNDGGGPPLPMMPAATPPISSGSAPYDGVFAPTEALSGFNGYHAPGTNEADQRESWTLTVKDKKEGHAGEILCADLYLYRT